MKKTAACILTVFTLLATSARLVSAPGAYILECEVYRVSASVSGKTSLTEDIRVPGQKAPASAIEGRFTFFTLADLDIGSLKFHFDEAGARWNGQATLPDQNEIVLLARPRIAVKEGQAASMYLGGMEKVEFMVPQSNGFFELRTAKVDTGLNLQFNLSRVQGKHAVLDSFTIEITSMAGRKRVDKVSLDIGEPLVKKDTDSVSLCLLLDRPYAIQWLPEGQGMLMLVLQVKELKEKS